MNWEAAVEQRDVNLGIIGLGYVGLPLAVEFASAGFSVTGFDVSEQKVEQINSGDSPVSDVSSEKLAAVVEPGQLEATADMERLSEMDSIHICVPTPLRKSRDPDISHIVEAVQTIVENFEPPSLVTLESTTYPGTTEEVVAEAFRAGGWEVGDEVLLAFSPERVDPGNETYGLSNTPKVIGGYSEESARVAGLIYGDVVGEVVRVSSTKEAEMVKLLENTFRSINIGLANEMALVCDRMDINVWEVIDAAATKPFGFMPFYPGPGLGGHCIPIDPLFLSWRANLDDFRTRFIELADEVNRSMPDHVYQKVSEGLNKYRQSVNGSRLCIFGVAYKPEVSDTRESPAHNIIRRLIDAGAEVDYCDPYVDEFQVDGQYLTSVKADEISDRTYDAGVIITDHEVFEWGELLENVRLVVDSRNALAEAKLPKDTDKILL